MNVYVWTDFCPDYSSGLAVAIAENETDARRLVAEYLGGEPYQWGDLEIRPLEPQAHAVYGGS